MEELKDQAGLLMFAKSEYEIKLKDGETIRYYSSIRRSIN
jgi:hypothetical protein